MIYKLFNYLNKDFEIIRVLPQKKTARCPLSIIVKCDNAKKLVVIADTKIQKFYLERSIKKQQEFYEDFSEYFKFNFPETTGVLGDFSYAIYPYLENLKWVTDKRPIEIIQELYSKKAQTVSMDSELLQKIEMDFLSSWPDEFHEKIKQSDLYKEYFDKIRNSKEVKIYKEHGDYTVNNILTDGKDLYLVDFEFAKDFQVIGLDEHDYKRTLPMKYLNRKDYSKLKENLMNKISNVLDKNKINKFSWIKPPKTDIASVFKGIKIKLIDYSNNLIDKSCEPIITLLNNKEKESKIKLVNPNFIYNRFDIRFGNNFDLYKISENNKEYYVPFSLINAKTGILGVWLVDISVRALDKVIVEISKKYPKLKKVQTRYSLNYQESLEVFNHWIVLLPNTIETFDNMLSKKTRYNVKWYPKKIEKELGTYKFVKYALKDISNEIVQKYFEFKLLTHGYDYKMTEREYLKTFYITSAYVLYINNKIEAVLFDSNLENISYLENFAYNINFSKYSLGMVLYHYYIEDLINNNVKYIFLGDGKQEYKKRYNGENRLAFDGYISIKRKNKSLKYFLNRLKNIGGKNGY